MGKLQSGSGQE